MEHIRPDQEHGRPVPPDLSQGEDAGELAVMGMNHIGGLPERPEGDEHSDERSGSGRDERAAPPEMRHQESAQEQRQTITERGCGEKPPHGAAPMTGGEAFRNERQARRVRRP